MSSGSVTNSANSRLTFQRIWGSPVAAGAQGPAGPQGVAGAGGLFDVYAIPLNSENPAGTSPLYFSDPYNVNTLNIGKSSAPNQPDQIAFPAGGVYELTLAFPVYYSANPSYFFVDMTFTGTGAVIRHNHPITATPGNDHQDYVSFSVIVNTAPNNPMTIMFKVVTDATWYMSYNGGTSLAHAAFTVKKLA